MREVLQRPVRWLAAAVRGRQVSAVELTSAYLARIEAVNPRLNAVTTLAADLALTEARRADAAVASGAELGPLHGVPMTVKDSFDTAGVRTTCGTAGRRDFVPSDDATAVKRLKHAGAILLGKTNTPELTLTLETDNPVHGRTNNPYDLACTVAGSSGGSAAIVSAWGSAFDLGSDTGGSIRQPCHFCGIAGIKPTTGRVSRIGHHPGPGGILERMTTVGPMARHVDDLAYLLPVIAGPDGRDPFLAPTPLGDPKSVRLEDLHVAFYTDNGICAADPQIAGRVERCAEALAEAGARVTPAVPPRLAEATQLYRDLFWGWDGGAWVRRLLREAGTDERDSVLTRYLESKLETPAYLLELIDRWDRMRFEMTRFLEPFDVILAPVNAWTFVPHGGIYPDRYPGFTYPQPFSLTGWPVVAVPAGMASSGIPIAVQVVAKPWRDDVALAAARHLEQQCGGWIAPPI